MSDNHIVTEYHGCIVCGKTYTMLVVYSPDSKLIDCTVTSLGGQRVRDTQRPLVACDTHPAEKIEAAYARRYSSMQPEDDAEDREP